MSDLVPAAGRSAADTASARKFTPDDLGVAVTAAFAIRFPRGSTLPGTTYAIGRWAEVVHFAPIGRQDLAPLTAGTLDRLITLCRIPFRFSDVHEIPRDDVLRLVACDSCLIAMRRLPRLELI